MVTDRKEEMTRWKIDLIQPASDAGRQAIRKHVKLFLDTDGQASDILANHKDMLGRQCRPRTPSSSNRAPKARAKRERTNEKDGSTNGANDSQLVLSGTKLTSSKPSQGVSP